MSTQNIKFSKYNATGNDFIIVNEEDFALTTQQIARLCHRRFGIGADGLLVLSKKTSSMRIFNSDGGEADMCGNGLSAACAYLSHSQDKLALNSLAGEFECFYDKPQTTVVWKELKEIDSINIDDLVELSRMLIDSGVPHLVSQVEDIQGLNILEQGRRIRYDQRFLKGVNACFFQEKQRGEIDFRVYERGVEGETYSCGTGVVAAAFACQQIFNWNCDITVNTLGGTAVVKFVGQSIHYVTSPVEVFKGVYAY